MNPRQTFSTKPAKLTIPPSLRMPWPHRGPILTLDLQMPSDRCLSGPKGHLYLPGPTQRVEGKV